MWLRLAMEGRVAILEERLMLYRMAVKKSQSYYQYNYLRTGVEDFFKVMDSHLSSKSDGLFIPGDALEMYELRKNLDYLKRGLNHLIKGENIPAKELLGKLLSISLFILVLKHLSRPKYLVFWILGLCVLFLTYLGLGKFLGRLVHWYVYVWRRRKIATE